MRHCSGIIEVYSRAAVAGVLVRTICMLAHKAVLADHVADHTGQHARAT